MTLTTFKMEKEGIERMISDSVSMTRHNPLDFINDFLPGTFPGRVIDIWYERSVPMLMGLIYARVEFDEYGTEEVKMEVPDITPEVDIFKLFVNCIKERLVHLEARKRKHLGTLVNNLYKGV
jgi:hypothetical protein